MIKNKKINIMETKDTNKLIKFYKGYVLPTLHTHLIGKGTIITIDELDCILKEFAGYYKQSSCSLMTVDELQELIVWSFNFGDMNGIFMNYKDNDFELEIKE